MKTREDVSLDDCWIIATYKMPTGYGKLCEPRGNSTAGYLAHRVMYEDAYGPIPAELQIDHICDNKSCINPEHLQAVTRRQNMRKYYKPNSCNKGHELTPDNVVYELKNTKNGCRSRVCRICKNARLRKYYRNRVERLKVKEVEDE